LYLVVCLFLAVLLVFIADRAVGFLLPDADFPWNGVASVPCEDKSIDFYDFQYTCSTNSMGLRDAEVGREKKAALRIAAIGDSYTFGWGVDLKDAWVKRVERTLRERGLDVEIINCGKPAAGPLDYVRLAEMVLCQLHPDMIIIGLLQGNDLLQAVINVPELYFPHLSRLSRDWGQLWKESPPPPTQRYQQSSETHRLYLADVARQELGGLNPEARARYEGLDDEVRKLFLEGRINPWMISEAVNTDGYLAPAAHLDWPETKRLIWVTGLALQRIRILAEKHGAQVMVVSIPTGVFDNRPFFERCKRLGFVMDPATLMSDGPDRAGRAAAERAGVPFYEVTQEFRDRGDDPDLYFKMDNHFTSAGHALFAEKIAPFVEGEIRKLSGGDPR
jgi:lysophospholipase L1-like esterase